MVRANMQAGGQQQRSAPWTLIFIHHPTIVWCSAVFGPGEHPWVHHKNWSDSRFMVDKEKNNYRKPTIFKQRLNAFKWWFPVDFAETSLDSLYS